MEPLDRRELLERAGLAALVAAGFPELAEAATRPRDRRLRELAAAVRGPVFVRGDAAYTAARIPFNTRFDRVKPLAVVLAASVADVQKTIRWARRYGIRLVPRTGRHSYGGYSTTSGIVLDVTRLNGIHVNRAARTATIGAGALLGDVYSALAQHGVTIPAGSCPTVGLAGLALGGGVGFASRKFGLTCDNIRALTIVTASGEALVCDARRHSDLFWACRGGGGGNFGVVTSFTFRTHPVSTVAYYSAAWPWSRAVAVGDAWQRFAPGAPDDLFSVIRFAALGQASGGPAVTSNGQFFGSEEELRAVLRPLTNSVPPSSLSIRSGPYLAVQNRWAGCSGRCRIEGTTPGGNVGRDTFAAKSDYVKKPLSRAGLETIVRFVEERQSDRRLAGGSLLLDSYGGAINRVPKAATAFVHRDALLSGQYLAYWNASDPASVAAANIGWLRRFHAAMRPYVSGEAYQNYPDPDLKNWARAYYGSNLPRLRAVKRKYDPSGFFRFSQSIPR